MSTKTIQVNRDYLSISGKTRRSGSKSKREKKERPKTLVKPNKVRKEFIKKIQAFQERRKTENAKVNDDDIEKCAQEFDDEFNKSLSFLQDLSAKTTQRKNNKNRTRRNKRNRGTDTNVNVSLEIPENLGANLTAVPTINASISVPDEKKGGGKSNIQELPVPKSSGVSVVMKPQPPYSNLKGTGKPTYREWMKTRKRELGRPEGKPTITIQGDKIKHNSERAEKLAAIKNARKNKNPPKKRPMIKSKRITRTIKHKLGRGENDKKVSVLIKNRETRKRVQSEKSKLASVSIIEIKRELRKRNLIKSGTRAPNDVLRKMYEQMILTGDVTNKNAEVLMHNYVNDN
jgi:predicted HTH domain antitoxin